jgi:hypothetical protein
MADAVEALVASASFNNGDRAKVLSGPLKLPSEKIVWLALVVFDGADGTEGHVVRFRAAEKFSAIEDDKPATFEMQVLDGAIVDFNGVVTLLDGRRLRAVEIIPAQMPYDLSELDFKIIHLTLSMIDGAESRCYRDIRDSLPDSYRDALPSRHLLDFSQLTEGPGRPALAVPLLKQIRAKFEDTYPTLDLPSEQKISDALEKAGIRIPERRPRAA